MWGTARENLSMWAIVSKTVSTGAEMVTDRAVVATRRY
jgi:hypothetical protein